MTMDPRFEAQQIRALGQIIRNGHFYKGAKPVYWCLDCRSSLAEAEVEYEDKTSPAVDVEFRVVDPADLRAARRRRLRRASATHPVSLVIWTTTPWTLPANEAVALGAEHRIRGGLGVAQPAVGVAGAGQRAARCLPGALRPRQGPGAGAVHRQATRAPAARASVPAETRARHRRRSRDAGSRHRRRAHRARAWPGRLHRRPEVQPAGRQPGDGRWPLPRGHAVRRRAQGGRRQRRAHQGAGVARPAAQARDHQAQLSALLAPQDAGDLPRHAAMVHQHGPEGPARERAARHPEGAVDSRLGRAAHLQHDRGPARLVPVAPAHLGRAHRAVRAQADAGAASAHAGADRRGGQARREGRHRSLVRSRSARVVRRRRRRTTRRSPTSWTCGPTRACRTSACTTRIPTRSSRRWSSTWKARTSIAAGSIPRC